MASKGTDNLFDIPTGDEDKKDDTETRLIRIEEGIERILSFFDNTEEE